MVSASLVLYHNSIYFSIDFLSAHFTNFHVKFNVLFVISLYKFFMKRKIGKYIRDMVLIFTQSVLKRQINLITVLYNIAWVVVIVYDRIYFPLPNKSTMVLYFLSKRCYKQWKKTIPTWSAAPDRVSPAPCTVHCTSDLPFYLLLYQLPQEPRHTFPFLTVM